jgi:hypothetical protein
MRRTSTSCFFSLMAAVLSVGVLSVGGVSLGGCGKPSRAREFRQRVLEVDWEDVGAWDAEQFVAGMRAYIESDDPAWPNDDEHYTAIRKYLFAEKPNPTSLRFLLGEYQGEAKVDTHLLKRDKIARSVLHSFMGRIFEANDPYNDSLWEHIVFAAVHFSFDPIYEASHPGAGESLGEFFSDPEITACPASERAYAMHMDAILVKWRARVTRKASSLFFGNVLRHLGQPGAIRLFGEWAGMDENERTDLLKRCRMVDDLGPRILGPAVEAMLDESYEVRDAAFELLVSCEAPLGDLDSSSQDESIEKRLPALRSWAAKTKS